MPPNQVGALACPWTAGGGGSPFFQELPGGRMKKLEPLSLDGIKTYSLAERHSKVSQADFGAPWKKGGGFREFVDRLPRILAGETLRGVAAAWVQARRQGRPVLLRQVRWAGAKPIAAYEFTFDSKGRRYRVVTPKPCSNFWVEEVLPRPPPFCRWHARRPRNSPCRGLFRCAITFAIVAMPRRPRPRCPCLFPPAPRW